MPVYAKQYGRLGNNLFQKAAAIGYAMKHGHEYALSGFTQLNKVPIHVRERGHQYQELEYSNQWGCRNIVLDGYFQSEKYFAHCREEVLKVFGYKWELRPGWCSLHVRRGDYLKYPDKHPVVTETYLITSIMEIKERTGVNYFLLFSDDIAWCKAVFSGWEKRLGCYISYSEGQSQEQDLIAGSCCEHNIISNSTFSWWQGWLNQNPDKVVISPSRYNWFGPGNANLDTSDIIPEPWIQIKY